MYLLTLLSITVLLIECPHASPDPTHQTTVPPGAAPSLDVGRGPTADSALGQRTSVARPTPLPLPEPTRVGQSGQAHPQHDVQGTAVEPAATTATTATTLRTEPTRVATASTASASPGVDPGSIPSPGPAPAPVQASERCHESSVSVVAACRGRRETLSAALPSWAQLDVCDIVVVDWASDPPLEVLAMLPDDPRLQVGGGDGGYPPRCTPTPIPQADPPPLNVVPPPPPHPTPD